MLQGEKKFTRIFVKIAQGKRTLGLRNAKCRETHKMKVRTKANSTGLKYSPVLDLLGFVMGVKGEFAREQCSVRF
jgi:hypothetical protein